MQRRICIFMELTSWEYGRKSSEAHCFWWWELKFFWENIVYCKAGHFAALICFLYKTSYIHPSAPVENVEIFFLILFLASKYSFEKG